jgi:hypothetical protein
VSAERRRESGVSRWTYHTTDTSGFEGVIVNELRSIG